MILTTKVSTSFRASRLGCVFLISEEFFLENKRLKAKTNNVVSFNPNGDYYYHKALKCLERDDMDKAYKYIQRAAELSPADAHVLLQYGILEMEAQNFEHAHELIHTAYSLEPSEPEITFMLAEVSGCMGLMHDAKKYADKYLAQAPDGVYAQDAHEILEFVDLEHTDYNDVDENDADKMIAQEKARRLMEQGNFTQAIEVLEQTIEQYPALWAAHNNLALAYFYVGEADQAKALLQEVLRENHGNLHALCNLTVFAYYEKEDEQLKSLLDMLTKIQPYEWENRYKLGATLALVGQYEQAYKWLRSMSKRGYEGDSGFYFWLAQAAYYSGHEDVARTSWASLVDMDPSKAGYEPWLNVGAGDYRKSAENNRELLMHKLSAGDESDRMFGLFLLRNSTHKQEMIAHPSLIDVSKYSNIEKLSLAYALEHPFNLKVKEELYFERLMAVAEEIVKVNGSINVEVVQILHIWFSISKTAFEAGFTFKNIKAIAAAMEYTFNSAMDTAMTKKQLAEKYGTTVTTLTKYMDALYDFVPTSFE